MSSPSTEEQTSASQFIPFTSAERIRQLNEIDKSITQLVRSAGKALQTLSNAQDDSSVIKTPPSANTRKELFSYSANTYLETLQSIDVRLQRNIFGLEEAGIIVPGKPKKKSEKDSSGGASSRSHNSKAPEQRKNTELGLGNLDIGWLNSRSGRVGRGMEAELWSKAKLFLEEIEARNTQDGKNVEETAAEDEAMEP